MTKTFKAHGGQRPARPRSPGAFSFREIALQEFWIVAKYFFAPIYGTHLALKQLHRMTRRVDKADARAATKRAKAERFIAAE